jgi:glycine/D-amino acid oxidase-like deaminating enzyme
VILIGGGVMGCAAAYYLCKTDPTIRVAILEKDPAYEHSSTVLSDGNIRLQFHLKENILISLYGLQVLETFTEDMAVGDWQPKIDLRKQGNLFLSDEENRLAAQSPLEMHDSLNCKVSWLEPGEIAARFPLLDVTHIAGGTFGELDGTMDPYAVLIAYKNKAVDMGAKYIPAKAAEILLSGRHVTGVRLADGTKISAGRVINSAGAWCTSLAATAGIHLPVEPVMRNVFIVEVEDRPENIYPLTVFPSGLYFIQEHGNRFLVSQSFEDDPVGFNFIWKRATFEERLWSELVEYVPAFDRLKIVGGWAGLYAVNRFDGNAILGEWPDLSGFFLANGFSGHGFQQCHAVGRYLSELIRGVQPSLDLSIFSPKRIMENKPVYEGYRKLV